MTWTKLGAEWPDEARHLSSDAYRLHVDALCFSNRLLSNLLIYKRDVARFAWIDDVDPAVKELVAGGWWEDRGDRWYLGRRFANWQRTREQVETKRATDTKAQKRKRLHDTGDHSECISNCPAGLLAYDDAHDHAHESSRSSERNGTERNSSQGEHPPTEPWPPVARPGGGRRAS